MIAKLILKSLDWDDIFENTSQYENLYDFLKGKGKKNLDRFILGFYPKSKNQKIIKSLKTDQIPYFKKHAKKLWNMSKVQDFCIGNEAELRKKYIKKL